VGGRKEDKENTGGSSRKEQGFLQNLGRGGGWMRKLKQNV